MTMPGHSGQAKGTSARRLVGWVFSIAAVVAMTVAFLASLAMPAAADASGLVITITAPASPPANDVLINTDYSIGILVTYNGNPWGSTGWSKQVNCYAQSAPNDTSGHWWAQQVQITNGIGTFTYHEQTAGTDTVTCYASDVTISPAKINVPSNTLSVVWTTQDNGGGGGTGPTATLSAIASCSPACVPAVTPGDDITVPVGTRVLVQATMTNLGSPVQGETLYFSLESGSVTPPVNIPPSGTTGVDGTTSFYYYNTSGNPGTDIIDVNIDDLDTATVTIHWTASTSFTLSPPSQTVQTNNSTQVTANFKINGVAIQGASVSLAITGGGPNDGATAGPVNTDVNGNAIFNITDGGGTGTDTLTATTSYGSGYTSNPVTITWQEPTTYSVVLTPPTQTHPVNQPGALATVNATISPTPPSGSYLKFQIASGPNQGNSKTNLISGNTASWSYNDSSSNAGTDIVQAVSITPNGNPPQSVSSNSVNVDWGGATAGITLDLQPSNAQALLGHQITFTATATQANSLPAAGIGITFTVSGPNSDQQLSSTTDNNGQAVFSYTDSHATNGESDTITAQLLDGPSQTAKVTWVSTSSESIALCVGTSTDPCTTSGDETVNQSATVTALVTMGGTPQQGAEVTFSVPSGNNHPLSKTVLTDVNGEASYTYTGGVIGTDTVQATTPAAASPATVTIDWQAGNHLTFTQDPSSGTVGTANTYKVQLSGPGGVVSGETVTFTVTGANGPRTVNKTTDSNGYASFSYTGQNTGLDSIEASANGAASVFTTTTWSTSNGGGGGNPGSVTNVTLSTSNSRPYIYFQSETMTATVTVDGAPATFGTEVTFTVAGSNPQTFTGTTGTGGVATFTYTGRNTGRDTVTATVNGVTSSPVSVNWRWFF